MHWSRSITPTIASSALQDVDLIVAECRDLLAHHGIRDDAARQSIKAMLEDQPLPLQGHRGPVSPQASLVDTTPST